MQDELDWLREAAPPPGDPDQLVLRRARNRLEEETRAEPLGADGSPLLLPVEGPAHLQADASEPPASTRGRRGRVAVLGSVAATLVLVAGLVWLTAGRDGGETELDESATSSEPRPEPGTQASAVPEETQPGDAVPQLTTVPVDLSSRTDLADGQLVSVTAKSIGASAVWLAQCVDSATATSVGLDGCDLGTVQIGSALGDGSVAVEFRVRRHLQVDGTTVDCSAAACIVALTRLDDSRRAGTVPIAFDPSAPPSTGPRLEVEPATGLVDGQRLAVRGTGFDPSTDLRLLQCVIGVAETEPNCLQTTSTRLVSGTVGDDLASDTSGGFHTSVYANRIPASRGGELDCAALSVGRCVLVVVDREGHELLAVQPLEFDPAVAPPTPGIAATPASGLGDGAPVTISITSFAELSDAELQLCAVGFANRCVTLPLPDQGQRGSTLAFELELPRLFDARDGHTHDCALDGPCELRLRAPGRTSESHAIAYDPDAPLADSTPIRADPAGPFRPGDPVTLTLPTGRSLHIGQCAVDVPVIRSVWDRCDVYSRIQLEQGVAGEITSATGPVLSVATAGEAVELQLEVFRRIALPDGRSHDCVTDGACELVIRASNGPGRYDPVPLEFDPATAPLDVPKVAISKTGSLEDREEVTISVAGLLSATTFDIQLCPGRAPIDVQCPLIARHDLGASDLEELTVALPRSTIDPVTGRIFDCAMGCSLRVTNSRVSTEVAIQFDSRVESAPPPELETDAATAQPGKTVAVTGTGFPSQLWDPSLDSYICETRPDEEWSTVDLAAACFAPPESAWGAEPVVGRDGTFTSTFVVPTEIRQPSREVAYSCGQEPCWLVVATAARVAGPVIAAAELT